MRTLLITVTLLACGDMRMNVFDPELHARL
jgi:hypothetical protein